MKKFVVVFIIIFAFQACKKVPMTDRRQVSFIPNSQLLPLSFTSYNDMMNQTTASSNREWTSWVRNSGERISKAVEIYLKENGNERVLKGFDWEFNLIADPTVNAFCMPGGKIAFYEGIMPICQSELGTAVVMGHEIAHAIANHGGERMSQGLIQQLGAVSLSAATRNQPETTKNILFTAYGVGSNFGVMMPFSRSHESEADELGLYFMALAGYDPREAPKFWDRMAANSGGGAPPEFLSTHPSHRTRISDLNNAMPKAMEYYNRSRK
ncbi:MAG: M48 family metallopeptidase [Cyclobacteriaceae bacterium]|nr:M48 family metallopeptidase [Cyclobacteriaceae bacterium]MCH8517259.1 M48 family metallopeptidase [Cyclobacteriaceae bacterium]